MADIDRAMTGGPGLRWAFMGPHMTYHLGGGKGGIAHYFDILSDSQTRRWAALGSPRFDDETKAKIIRGIAEETGNAPMEELGRRRDATLFRVLKAVQQRPPG